MTDGVTARPAVAICQPAGLYSKGCPNSSPAWPMPRIPGPRISRRRPQRGLTAATIDGPPART